MTTCGRTPCYARPADTGERYCYQCQVFVTEGKKAVDKARGASRNGPSEIEREFDYQWSLSGKHLPEPECEYRPWPERKHKIDRAWPDLLIAIEIEGWGHGMGSGTGGMFDQNLYKYNRLSAEGWILLRCNRKILMDEPNPFFDLLKSCIHQRLNVTSAPRPCFAATTALPGD